MTLEPAPEAKQRSNREVINYQLMEEMLFNHCKSTDRPLANDEQKMELVRAEMHRRSGNKADTTSFPTWPSTISTSDVRDHTVRVQLSLNIAVDHVLTNTSTGSTA